MCRPVQTYPPSLATKRTADPRPTDPRPTTARQADRQPAAASSVEGTLQSFVPARYLCTKRTVMADFDEVDVVPDRQFSMLLAHADEQLVSGMSGWAQEGSSPALATLSMRTSISSMPKGG